jgi:hypothetical protein
MIKQSSDPVFPLETQIKDSSERTSDSAIPLDEQDPLFAMRKEVHEVCSEDRYFDTTEPTKVFNSSLLDSAVFVHRLLN